MLSEEEKLKFLKATDLFGHLTSEGLASICQIIQENDYPAGQVLFNEGDIGDSLYLVVDGEVGIIKDDIQVLALNETGTCIGEMALIDDEPRSATVKITKDTKLIEITREDFYKAMAGDFLIAQGMFRVLSTKLRHDTSALMSAIRRDIARQASMRMAAEVQESLLPEEEIDHPRLGSAGHCQPADSVGGDYYDYIQLPEDRVAIFLGDVMGHGYHSAMLTAMTKSGLHTQIGFDHSLSEVMKAINSVAEQHIRTWIYLTCCCVIIDLQNQKLEFTNAGHPPMFLYRAATKEIIELESQFMPLGLLPTEEEIIYQGEELSWYPDDVLVMYSDGITEAENPKEDMYGGDRLKDSISTSASLSPSEIQQAILADLEAHCQGQPAADDITLVVLKWK